ncbi:MAG: hypothetical protein AAF944_24335 [Bacteroidota bacterium]
MIPTILTIPLEKGADQSFSSTWPEGKITDELVRIPSSPFPTFYPYHSTNICSSISRLASSGLENYSWSSTQFLMINGEDPFGNISSTNQKDNNGDNQ